jgi:putative aldouronate transport system permease protein
MMPFFSVYPHMNLSKDVAAAFPTTISGFTVIGQGNGVLPVSLMPSLGSLDFRGTLLLVGVGLSLLGGVLCMFFRRGLSHAAVLSGGAGMLLLFLFAFYTQQLDTSLLYDVMLTATWYVWAIFAFALFLFGLELWVLKYGKPLPLGDMGWRLMSAALCAAALCMLLLPFVVVHVPSGTFSSSAEDALASRTLTGWQWLAAKEPQLQKISAENSAFADPASTGAMASLVSLSASGKDLKNLFMIPTNNGSVRMMAVVACAFLFIGLILQLTKKVDRWIPACIITLSAVMLLSEAVGTLTVDSRYQFLGAAYQMMYMGFGGYTPNVLFMAAASCCAAAAAVMGIRLANAPYFVNPIPEKKRLLTVSIFLAFVSAVLLMLPVFQVNLYTPGKINQSNPTVSRPMSGLEMITFQKPDVLLNPVNTRGKLLYGAESAKNGLTAVDIRSLVSGALNKMSAVTLCALLITLAGLALLFGRQRNKRAIIAVLLSGSVAQALAAVLTISALPKDIGFLTALGPLYISMGTTVFSAFFAGFIDRQVLPKKYKLFLMMMPFLVAVLLFSYLPLSGWRYAFYNFKLELPMDQQEYVGFKWFTALFSSPAQQGEIVRVMRNTFAMSGIGLATSWMPVAFAIFLTEIRTRWFKKFVQIFTTLPNFISWVLVFSFALTIFSLDTGIMNKLLVQLRLIKEPIAYLNSSEHIWLKMWLWNTWKSLGWGAIMYLAAIAGIDQELYDAARVDGAGRWRQIYHITIPGLLPTFFVLLLLSVSNIVNNGMEQYLVFQNAMNKSTIEVLDLHVYNISLGTRSSTTISLATAIGILKSLISIVMLFLANSFSKLTRGESIV